MKEIDKLVSDEIKDSGISIEEVNCDVENEKYKIIKALKEVT